MRVKLSRSARWAVPGTAVLVTAGVIAGLQVPAAQAAPKLPVRTPAQLLAEISNDAKLPPLTGTVVETTSLGLPQLPSSGSPTSLSSLLTGSHTVKVYYQDPAHFRLAVPQPESETDFIRNGSTLWLWNSQQNSVTKFAVPAKTGKHAAMKPEAKLPKTPVLTPQQAANRVLKAVGKTTVVSLQTNVMIAGEPAYQLVLAPKDHRSLVGQVVIAVDATYGAPLRVQVFARGSGTPAFQVGYTNLDFTRPAAANFDFTPPPGATVKTETPGSAQQGASPAGQQNSAGVGTYGKGWLRVVAFPAKDLTGSIGTSPAGSGSAPVHAGGPAGVMGGDSQAVLHAILGSAKPVHGSWGSGTMVTTSLVSMLITNGEVYLGAVEPNVLYAAVGHTSAG